jgi:hypothetical protein
VFSTRFECIFSSSPLVSSVVSDCVVFTFNFDEEVCCLTQNLTVLNNGLLVKTTLETSGEDVISHSKRVEKIQNYTQNECNFFSKLSNVYQN